MTYRHFVSVNKKTVSDNALELLFAILLDDDDSTVLGLRNESVVWNRMFHVMIAREISRNLEESGIAATIIDYLMEGDRYGACVEFKTKGDALAYELMFGGK